MTHAEIVLHGDRASPERCCPASRSRARSGRCRRAPARHSRAPARAAAVARSEVSSPSAAMWRSRMPVRCTIHSSDVSTIAARSSLVSTFCREIAADPADHASGSCRRRLTRLRRGRRCAVPSALSSAIIRTRSLRRHLAREVDGAGKALRVGAAMRLDHHAVQPEEHAAIHLARIHLLPQQPEGRAARRGSRAAPPRCAPSPSGDTRRSVAPCPPPSSARCCRQSPRSPRRRPCPCRGRRPR